MSTPQLQRLHEHCHRLRLYRVEAELTTLLEQAAKRDLGYADFLDELLALEVRAKAEKHLAMRTAMARFPFHKTLETFDFKFQPSIDAKVIRELATTLHADDPLRAVRRIQGLLALARKYGPAPVDRACAVALDFAGPSYQVVRRYLERHPPAPLTLRQVDPLIRQLTLYRDLLQGRAPQEGDDDDAAP